MNFFLVSMPAGPEGHPLLHSPAWLCLKGYVLYIVLDVLRGLGGMFFLSFFLAKPSQETAGAMVGLMCSLLEVTSMASHPSR